jgi:hypothetical protein
VPSPIPKHPSERRNRNQKQGGEWIVLPADGYKGKIPSLAGLGLNKGTHAWWKKIWRTPMATQWTEGDIPALLELAALRERLLDGKISIAGEVRLRSDQFGLTPAGRQQRRWVITEEDAVRAGTADELAIQRNRRRLQAVDPKDLTN